METEKKIYKLNVSLKGSWPAIWRRIYVSSDIGLEDFHNILQIVMGWRNCHEYRFIKEAKNYYIASDENNYPGLDFETVDKSNFKLDQLLKEIEDTMVYYYDFSEGWEHTIRVENILPFNTRNNRKLPVCTGGKLSCPPENCGGMRGYYYLLKALGDPTHPEHGEMSEWVGVGINPVYFEIDEINEALDERFP